MKILFVGGLFNAEQERDILANSKAMPNLAANIHQHNILDGLSQEYTVINPLFVGSFPFEYKKMVVKKSVWSHDGLSKDFSPGFLNIFALKQISRRNALLKALRKWLLNNNQRDSVIVIYTLDYSFLSAVSAIKKSFKGKTCAIVPDLPIFYANTYKKSRVYNLLKKIEWKKILKHIQKIDSFILLTEQMKEMLGVSERPYIVSEGICSGAVANETKPSSALDYTITYTGTLDKEFGIIDLIDAFKELKNKNYVLQVAGDGNAKDYVVNYAKTDHRVRYYGVLTNKETIELQRNSRLLVNPRQSDKAFTNYSFPSKTLEYLKSGRPVLMHRLPGVPKDYDDYLMYFDCSLIKDIANRIDYIMNLDDEKLDLIGKKGKAFVETEKSIKKQGQKIMAFLKEVASE